jgi:predicted RNase H-like HicB family nuclease
MTGAIALHLEGLQVEGLEVPEPHAFSIYVEA